MRTEAAAVSATPAAREAIDRLRAAYGPIAFFQSGGCCDGSSPLCFKDGELPISPHDILLGEVSAAPFYIDGEQYERWGRPRFLIDVSEGAAEGFSLESLIGLHFLSRAP
jgi:uncharacterized protein (DUF779 family)